MVAKKHELAASGKKASLVDMVLNIMGIQNAKSISLNTTLADLGVDSLMTIEIQQALEREFDICMSTQDLRATTFQTLQTLSVADGNGSLVLALAKSERNISEIFNVKDILSNIVDDNLDPIYRLTSKFSGSSFENSVLIMAGAEGDTNLVWRSLCAEIELPTFIGNYTVTLGETSLVEIAKIYAQVCSSLLFLI